MSGEQKKVATTVVGIAKRKAAAREAVGLLKKAESNRRKRLAAAAVGLLKAAAGGWVPRKPHEPYEGQGWTPPKPHEPRMANAGGAGWTPPKPHEPRMAQGWTPPKPHDPRTAKQPAPARKPAAPAPAQMKSPPTKAPAPKPALGQYRKVSAEHLALELLVKTAERLKKDRATTFKKAATAYTKAMASGNKDRIKKAVAHLAGVMTFDEMTKQAVSGEVGSLLMRILGRITPRVGQGIGAIGGETAQNIGQRISSWGKLLGERGKRAWGALRSGANAETAGAGGALNDLLSRNPGLIDDVMLAKQIGTGTLTAGGLAGLGALRGD